MRETIQDTTDSIFVRKNNKRYFNLKNNKNKNIIEIEYNKVYFVHSIEQYRK